MEKMQLAFDDSSLLEDLECMYFCIHEYLCGAHDEDIWWAAESLVRIHAFVGTILKKYPTIVASISDEMAERALQEMLEWIESYSPVDGWPDELLDRLG